MQYGFFLYDVEGARDFNTGAGAAGKASAGASPKALPGEPKLGFKALDAQTFEVRLNKPAAYFIYLTAVCPTFPMRRDVVEKWGDRWTEPEHIITNGPFRLTAWQHEYKMELAANEKFYSGPPQVKTVKMFMVPEQSTAYALYDNNELDFIDNRSLATPMWSAASYTLNTKTFLFCGATI